MQIEVLRLLAQPTEVLNCPDDGYVDRMETIENSEPFRPNDFMTLCHDQGSNLELPFQVMGNLVFFKRADCPLVPKALVQSLKKDRRWTDTEYNKLPGMYILTLFDIGLRLDVLAKDRSEYKPYPGQYEEAMAEELYPLIAASEYFPFKIGNGWDISDGLRHGTREFLTNDMTRAHSIYIPTLRKARILVDKKKVAFTLQGLGGELAAWMGFVLWATMPENDKLICAADFIERQITAGAVAIAATATSPSGTEESSSS